MDFAKLIRSLPDWPAPGVWFRSITRLLRDAAAVIDLPGLGGSARLEAAGVELYTVLRY